MVYFREYSEAMDLTGKDLISLLDCTKQQVAPLTGPMVELAEMTQEELPGDYATTMTGEVADEIHEWPNATLGESFRHLVCKFRRGRLIELVWRITPGARFSPGPGPLPEKKPWWKWWK
jgi:hypothetical protein